MCVWQFWAEILVHTSWQRSEKPHFEKNVACFRMLSHFCCWTKYNYELVETSIKVFLYSMNCFIDILWRYNFYIFLVFQIWTSDPPPPSYPRQFRRLIENNLPPLENKINITLNISQNTNSPHSKHLPFSIFLRFHVFEMKSSWERHDTCAIHQNELCLLASELLGLSVSNAIQSFHDISKEF